MILTNTAYRLLALIEQFPGLHVRELGRQAHLSEALVGYHVRNLAEAGLVQTHSDGQYLRIFTSKGKRPRAPDLETISLLRQQTPLQIVLLLAEKKTATQAELAEALDKSKSTISYHVGKLLEHDVVEPNRGGPALRLKDRDHILMLLDRWRPPTALAENFEVMWAALYGEKTPRKHRRVK